ncbi:MAG: hypothetical protein ACRCWB_10825 [Enterovibrio sp.]
MKIRVIGAALFSLAALVGASHAATTTATVGANQSDYKAGPRVDCKMADGKVEYIPSQMCKKHGGMEHKAVTHRAMVHDNDMMMMKMQDGKM